MLVLFHIIPSGWTGRDQARSDSLEHIQAAVLRGQADTFRELQSVIPVLSQMRPGFYADIDAFVSLHLKT